MWPGTEEDAKDPTPEMSRPVFGPKRFDTLILSEPPSYCQQSSWQSSHHGTRKRQIRIERRKNTEGFDLQPPHAAPIEASMDPLPVCSSCFVYPVASALEEASVRGKIAERLELDELSVPDNIQVRGVELKNSVALARALMGCGTPRSSIFRPNPDGTYHRLSGRPQTIPEYAHNLMGEIRVLMNQYRDEQEQQQQEVSFPRNKKIRLE